MKKAGHVFTSMKTRFFKLEEGAGGCELKYHGKEEDAKEKGKKALLLAKAKEEEEEKAPGKALTRTPASIAG